MAWYFYLIHSDSKMKESHKDIDSDSIRKCTFRLKRKYHRHTPTSSVLILDLSRSSTHRFLTQSRVSNSEG